MTLRMLEIDMPSDNELLAVATIALDPDGQYRMSMVNVLSAPIAMTPDQQARALRLLATGVEAEAVGRGSDPAGGTPWHS